MPSHGTDADRDRTLPRGRRRIVERRAALVEVEDAAVVAALEHDDLLASGRGARERESDDVRLGAGVAEADELDRREPSAS